MLVECQAIKKAYKELLKKYLYHEQVLKRVERAMDILLRDTSYSIVQADTLYTITKKEFDRTGTEDQTKQYSVDSVSRTCTCPDFANGQTICKHRLAVMILALAEQDVLKERSYYA